MDQKQSIAERLAGSIKLDDQKLIDEIIESEIWNYDDDDKEATATDNEKHNDPHGGCHSPVDAVRQWQSQNPGKGDYSKERSHMCVILELKRSFRESRE
jgi:hypothetical protein